MPTFRGKIVSFNAGTYLAVVRIEGSGAQSLSGVPVNRAIASAEMAAGRTVVVDDSGSNVAADVIVLAVVG